MRWSRFVPLALFMTIVSLALSTPIRIERSFWAESAGLWVFYLAAGAALALAVVVLWLRALHELLGLADTHGHAHGAHAHGAHADGHAHHHDGSHGVEHGGTGVSL